MKSLFALAILSTPSVACIVGAILLALNSISGWGWLLFIAVITYPGFLGVKIKSN